MEAPSIKEVQPELMQRLLAADLDLTEGDFANHETDLYVLAKPGVHEWLKKNYKYYFSNVIGFTSPADSEWNGAGKYCLEIPFNANWPTDPSRTPAT